MDDYIKKHVSTDHPEIKIWRYVDDILIINKMNEEQIQNFVNELNKIKGRIRFSYEYQKDGSIHFLDTTLIRKEDPTIDVRWYRKNTASDRLLNY